MPRAYPPSYLSSMVIALLTLSQVSFASPSYQPAGRDLTQGQSLQGNDIFSGSGNAAALSSNNAFKPKVLAMSPSVGFSLEYGNVDNIYKIIDKLADRLSGSDSSDGSTGGDSGGDSSGGGGDSSDDESLRDELKDIIVSNVDIDKLKQDYPELEATLEKVAKQVAVAAAILVIMKAELYAKANASVDIPVVIGPDALGGSWSLAINSSYNSKVFGLVDDIQFDKQAALNAFETALQQDETPERIDFSDDLILLLDKQAGKVSMTLNNDSTLLTKVARIDELSLNYSRAVFHSDHGVLHLGVKPKYLNAGLSRVNVRIGDISDSEAIFDDLRNADLREEHDFGLDVGLIWDAERYYVGASLVNINEPEFDFPALNTTRYDDVVMIKRLSKLDTYTMEAQLKLSAGFYTSDKRWAFNLGLDANPSEDPMSDDYQWLTAAASYNTPHWYLPGARFGLRSNLVGSELTYLSAGLTFLKVVNLDLATTLDTVEVDGKELPRGMALNLGLQFGF